MKSLVISIAFVISSASFCSQPVLQDYLLEAPPIGVEERDTTVPVPLRPDPVSFVRSIWEVAELPNKTRLRSLYLQTLDEAILAADLERLLGALKRGTGRRPRYVFLKDLNQLPDRARHVWGQQIGRLTSQEASMLCMVGFEDGVQIRIPLRHTEDGPRIVPAEKLLGRE